MPSQSSSRPLHTSVPPPVPPTHCMVPAMQRVTPALHGPVPLPHATPSPMTLSSTTPLQSLSIPSHSSVVGPMPPVHTSAPIEQVSTPGRHAPIELPHG